MSSPSSKSDAARRSWDLVETAVWAKVMVNDCGRVRLDTIDRGRIETGYTMPSGSAEAIIRLVANHSHPQTFGFELGAGDEMADLSGNLAVALGAAADVLDGDDSLNIWPGFQLGKR